MGTWDSGMNAEEREQWDRFVKHAREDAAEKIADSTFVMSLVPEGEPDIKFAVELGLSIMLDKPIIAVAMAGVGIPRRLREIADHVIELESDFDTGVGQTELQEKLATIVEQMKTEGALDDDDE